MTSVEARVTAILPSMRCRVSDWDDEEERADWWSYQREYAEAYELLTALQPKGEIAEAVERCAQVAADRAAASKASRDRCEPRSADWMTWENDRITSVNLAAAIRALAPSTPVDVEPGLLEALADTKGAMEYWAGCDEGCTPDEAVSQIMSSGGAWPANAYNKACAALAHHRPFEVKA